MNNEQQNNTGGWQWNPSSNNSPGIWWNDDATDREILERNRVNPNIVNTVCDENGDVHPLPKTP